jgi:hypothetical protein
MEGPRVNTWPAHCGSQTRLTKPAECGISGAVRKRPLIGARFEDAVMLEKAKSLLQPSARSDVPPFMVMDVVAAASRLEAQGRRIVHMEVGQPAAGAPATAIAAVRAALANGPHG